MCADAFEDSARVPVENLRLHFPIRIQLRAKERSIDSGCVSATYVYAHDQHFSR